MEQKANIDYKIGKNKTGLFLLLKKVSGDECSSRTQDLERFKRFCVG